MTKLFRIFSTIILSIVLSVHVNLYQDDIIDSSDLFLSFVCYPSIWVILMMLEFKDSENLEESEKNEKSVDLLANKNSGV